MTTANNYSGVNTFNRQSVCLEEEEEGGLGHHSARVCLELSPPWIHDVADPGLLLLDAQKRPYDAQKRPYDAQNCPYDA